MKIAFSTLGCKINQYDTTLMEGSLKEMFEIVPFNDVADVYVINTCTVTSKSDYQSRQLVRRAKRINERARIVVTGCYSQTNPERLSEIEGVDIILGNQEKFDLSRYLEDMNSFKDKIYVNGIGSAKTFFHSDIKILPNRTRAVLKVQDGCSSRCAYCIVPYARGEERSARPEWIITQVNNLGDAGYKEIVLSGVNLGAYGTDLIPQKSLAGLIKVILEETAMQRIRISSVEPEDVTDELIDVVAAEQRVCKHLHLPLQSGDDRILSRMRRQYNSAYFKKLILKVKQNVPDIGLGTDVIVGLPGEDERAYENSVWMIQELPFTYLHVFSYSKRVGTEAFNFNDNLPEQIKKDRSQRLIEIGKKKSIIFRSYYVDKCLDVLIEGERDKKTGMLKGLSGNYLRVFVKNSRDDLKNRIVSVRITGMDKNQQLIAEG